MPCFGADNDMYRWGGGGGFLQHNLLPFTAETTAKLSEIYSNNEILRFLVA